MSHISKTFGAVTALVDVSIRLRQGEVLALVGDNGRRQIHADKDSLRFP